ncbi:MAG: DUF115 domain-containing protein [Spirochaetaceae bacterium]|jgi:hypothetical protein|nr:DUF115 domain-containing protein [Spirochaetaceae bacterium]
MDKTLFERNLLALSQRQSALCSRLSAARTTLGRYRFLESRSGEPVPALVDAAGAAHALHSLVDPRREGERLVEASASPAGCLIFLGLGGGYYPEAALDRESVCQVLVIDYDIHGVAELLASREYIRLFNDPRFTLFVDCDGEALERHILETWKPALYGGIRVIPLRQRVEQENESFGRAGDAIKRAIDRLSLDYSVQAHFGKRWFSNIIRNMFPAEKNAPALAPVKKAVICAAGPSLDLQLPRLGEYGAKKRRGCFIISVDTALPALLKNGLKPDAVISIDCQHISYYHFMGLSLPPDIPLFLDLASTPLLASLAENARFFSGGHPLTRYLSRCWRPFPELDTSGANVTYAALSLAEYLGAGEIELYGADFSYPLGICYARGTYINPCLALRQNRLDPLEAEFSSFLYRSALLEKIGAGCSWYYQTPVLRGYREALEEKAGNLSASIKAAPGFGAPISLRTGHRDGYAARSLRLFSSGRASAGAASFLEQYREDIKAMPPLSGNIARRLAELPEKASLVLTTLLPLAAAVKGRQNEATASEIFEAARGHCLDELERVTGRR